MQEVLTSRDEEVMEEVMAKLFLMREAFKDEEKAMWCSSIVDDIEIRLRYGWHDVPDLINVYLSRGWKHNHYKKELAPSLAMLYRATARLLKRELQERS